MIGFEIETEQRQTKIALSLTRSMTLRLVATESSEQRNNVLLKVRYRLRITLRKPLGCGANKFGANNLARCDRLDQQDGCDRDAFHEVDRMSVIDCMSEFDVAQVSMLIH